MPSNTKTMKLTIEFFVAVLLLLKLEFVDCSLYDQRITSDCHQEASVLKCNESNKSFARELSPIFSQLMGHSGLHLLILFDDYNEDIIESLALSSSAEFFYSRSVFRYDGTNQTIRQMLTSTKTFSVTVTFCTALNTINIFRMVHRQNFQDHPLSWLLISRSRESTKVILEGIEGLFYDGTKVTVMTQTPNDHFTFSSAVVDTDGFIRFNTWRDNQGDDSSLFGRVSRSKKGPRISFHGRELRVAANEYVGFFVTDSDGSASGVDVRILRALSDNLNFTYRIVRPADGLWGNPLPDGTVTGLVGLASRREADFALCAVGVTSTREAVVDFSYPYYQGPLAIFTRAPKQKNRALAVFSPFTMQGWICIAAAASLIGVIVKLESMFARRLLKNTDDYSLQKYSYNLFRSLVIQGNLLQSYHWPQRIIFFSWYVFCLIISALYSGMLTAVLAIPAYETPVNSLTDLPRAVEEGFTVSILKQSSDAALFEEATEGIYKETWDLFNHETPSESFVERPDIGIRRVLEGKYIFISFRISNEILVNQIGKHKFHIARETFYPIGIGMACPPGAPYKDTFSEISMRMVECGLTDKWFQDEMDRFTGKSFGGSSDARSSAITLTHLQAAFFLIVLGFSIAGVTFLFENITKSL